VAARALRHDRRDPHPGFAAAALKAALDAIEQPAFLVGPAGEVLEANQLGRTMLGRCNDLPIALAGAVAGRRNAELALTPFRASGRRVGYLAIHHGPARSNREAKAADAARRWSLTARQSEVLGWVVRGVANHTIATELKISERAIEQHVSAIFDRAGVESRAALVAQALSND
jgi:DNA-binding CsgD family transcriptional regulator